MNIIINCPQPWGHSFESCNLEDIEIEHDNIITDARNFVRNYIGSEQCRKHLDDWGYITVHIGGTGFCSGYIATIFDRGLRGDDIAIEWSKEFETLTMINAMFAHA